MLVVDLLDFPGSVWPNILDLLGKKKKIILVGNKLDLLLPDHDRYTKNITAVMQEEFLRDLCSELLCLYPIRISGQYISNP